MGQMISALQRMSPRHRQLSRLADEELMDLVGRQDADAFEIVYDRHGKSAYSLAHRICGRQGLAEEVVQDAFMTVWRQGVRYQQDRGSLRSWLLAIVHHRAIDAVRRASVHDRRRAPGDGSEHDGEAPGRTDQEVMRREDARVVAGALDVLPAEQRRVVELAYYGGLSQSEVAATLDIPLGTVKGRMRLALEKLRGEMEGLAA
jgi:RNA polymerase sigma-70 factor (ECF subfamily)